MWKNQKRLFVFMLAQMWTHIFLVSSFEVKLGISQLYFAVSKFCYFDKYSWILSKYSSSGKVQAILLDKFCKCRKFLKVKTTV